MVWTEKVKSGEDDYVDMIAMSSIGSCLMKYGNLRATSQYQ